MCLPIPPLVGPSSLSIRRKCTEEAEAAEESRVSDHCWWRGSGVSPAQMWPMAVGEEVEAV